MMKDDVARIRALLARPGMTKLFLADAAGINRNTLNGVEEDDWNPLATTLDKIMDAVRKLERMIG